MTSAPAKENEAVPILILKNSSIGPKDARTDTTYHQHRESMKFAPFGAIFNGRKVTISVKNKYWRFVPADGFEEKTRAVTIDFINHDDRFSALLEAYYQMLNKPGVKSMLRFVHQQQGLKKLKKCTIICIN